MPAQVSFSLSPSTCPQHSKQSNMSSNSSSSSSSTADKAILVAGGALLGGAVTFALSKALSRATPAAAAAGGKSSGSDSAEVEMSTTSSAHTGAVYETDTAVSEYLQFHFGSKEDLMPYTAAEGAPLSALNFAQRTGALCTQLAREHNVPLGRALDIGCAVGATSFELSKDFQEVLGIDFSHAFVNAARDMKNKGSATYSATIEASIKHVFTAKLDAGVHPERTAFEQGDACALRADIAAEGKFSIVHGANLLCRLPEPLKFLNRLKDIVLPGGLVVLVSPYSWLPNYTPQDKWLGGITDASGDKESFSGLTAALEGEFELVHESNMPFLIREHRRKFQWGCSHATVWKRKAIVQ